jgi:probable rRNA maturation factor
MTNQAISLSIQDNVNKKKYLKKKDVLRWLNYFIKTDSSITIRIAQLNEAKQLNFTYRKINKATNVLSFLIASKPLVGDIILCHDIIKTEAQEQKKKLRDHYAHLIIHGCLHLLGYDHKLDADANQMEKKEINILKAIGITNPYLVKN